MHVVNFRADMSIGNSYVRGMGKLVSTKEVADEIGVARQTVSRWVRDGVITPARRTAGGQSRFDLDDVKRQLKAHLGEDY